MESPKSDHIFEIKSSSKTPYVYINFEKGLFELTGNSMPNSSIDFYYLIRSELDSLIRLYPDKAIFVSCRLEYLNSWSTKEIYELLRIFEHHENTTIYWYFLEDNKEMLELGQIFESMLDSSFNYIEIKHLGDYQDTKNEILRKVNGATH